MTRARAKLLEQQVNLFLAQSDICIDENFILPKSMHVCMIRFEEMTRIARGGEELMIVPGRAREEREAGARGDTEEIIEKLNSPGRIIRPSSGPDYPAGGLSGLH